MSRLPGPKGLRAPGGGLRRPTPVLVAKTSNTSVNSTSTVTSVGTLGGFSDGEEIIVIQGDKEGIVRFCGETKFAPGPWIGVELQEPTGKNNGTVQGIEYP